MIHLNLILGFFIFWSTNQIKSEEMLVEISEGDLETIEQHLKESRFERLDNNSTMKNFIQYHESATSSRVVNDNTVEICEWGKLAEELNVPANNVCNVVAVALKDRLHAQISFSLLPAVLSDFSNYKCYMMPIVNVEEFKVSKEVVFCPRTTVYNSSTKTFMNLDRFLIGDGDDEQNSIYVYTFYERSIETIELQFYMKDILRIDVIRIFSENEDDYAKLVVGLESKFQLDNYFCNAPVLQKQLICQYCAMTKSYQFNAENDMRPIVKNKKCIFTSIKVDTSGLVPYRCFDRSSIYDSEEQESVDVIYCPDQVFEINGMYFKQGGFFYSIIDWRTIQLFKGSYLDSRSLQSVTPTIELHPL